MNQEEAYPENTPNSLNDEELVQLIQKDDQEAFNLLYERYLSKVYQRVWYVVPNQDVEDVTQEVFLAAMKSIKTFRGDSKFSTWLRTLTNRQVADYYRRREREGKELDMELENIEVKATSRIGGRLSATSVDDMMMLRQALSRLPEHYRDILLLRFADGMKFNEIADLQGTHLEATKSLFRRAIGELRKQLGAPNA
jgi:RNA polymerase sigma-70 factor (ECF subfamily)